MNGTTLTGLERLRSDRRQLGGMMLVMGMCVTFQPLSGLSSFTDINQESSRIWLICCGIIQVTFGTLAMVVGYLGLVHDYGSRRLTGSLLLMTQLAWIPFMVGIIGVGIAASPPYTIKTRSSSSDGIELLQEYIANPFIPEDHLPNQTDVLFFGSMGILGLISYGFGFFGSLVFLASALYKFDVGKPVHRDANFYRGRLLFYTFALLIAGMSQILLGAYVLFEFGAGPLSPPVGVEMYNFSFPEISMAVGSIQMIIGYFGVGNYLHLFPVGPNDNKFQFFALVGWFLQLILQYIIQIGFMEGSEHSATVPSLALYSFGINVFPPFLDYKMRTTPTLLDEYYYGVIEKDDEGNDEIGKDFTSPKIPKRPDNYEKALLPKNMKTIRIRRTLGGDHQEDSDNKSEDEGIQKQTEQDYDSKENFVPKKRPLTELFSRVFPIYRSQTASQQVQPDNESMECISDHNIKHSLNEQKVAGEEPIQNANESDINQTAKDHDGPVHRGGGSKFDTAETGGYQIEPGVTVEEIVEYPDEFGTAFDETVEYPKKSEIPITRTTQHFPESGIIVEEFIEYPDDLSRENTYNTEDTWGDQERKQILLSPIQEEDSQRILSEEETEKGPLDGKNSRPKSLVPSSNEVMHPNIPDSYYDYDTDDGFEISEATPDDDTAALDAKIEKLKGELISDTNLESYLNQIL